MVTKMTLRLPDYLAKRLREDSEECGRSLNDAAIYAIARGLEAPKSVDEDDRWWLTLGDLLERPPTEKFDLEALRRFHATLPPTDTSIDDTLDWIRQDRDV